MNPENSALFSCDPDLAGLDSVHDLLIESFAASVRRWGGDLPRSRMEFERVCVGLFAGAIALTAPEEFGGLLAQMIDDEICDRVCEAVVHSMAEVIDNQNPGLTARCIAFAAGLHGLMGGISETAIAEQYGITRAAVSKRVTAYQRRLRLNPSRGMKSLQAQQAYRERAHEVHGTAEAEPKRDSVSLIAAIDRIRQFFSRLTEMSGEERAAAKRQLAPVVEIYLAL